MSPLSPGDSARDAGHAPRSYIGAWIVQLVSILAPLSLSIGGLVTGTRTLSGLIYPLEIGIVVIIVGSVLFSVALRLQTRAATRIHPTAIAATILVDAELQLEVAQIGALLKITARGLNVRTHYAIAFDDSCISFVLGSLRPQDIVTLPVSRISKVTVERRHRSALSRKVLLVNYEGGDSPMVLSLALSRSLALFPLPIRRDELSLIANRLRASAGINL